MTRAHLLSIRFADGAYGIRDSSVGGMVPKMNAHAGAFSSDSGSHVPRWVSIAASDPVVQQIGKLYRASANIGPGRVAGGIGLSRRGRCPRLRQVLDCLRPSKVHPEWIR
jgi:hypothetical protein